MDTTMTEPERAESREIGLQAIRGIEYTFKVLNGEIPRSQKTFDEKIKEWEKLAGVLENEQA